MVRIENLVIQVNVNSTFGLVKTKDFSLGTRSGRVIGCNGDRVHIELSSLFSDTLLVAMGVSSSNSIIVTLMVVSLSILVNNSFTNSSNTPRSVCDPINVCVFPAPVWP